jgi:hypothetical protein
MQIKENPAELLKFIEDLRKKGVICFELDGLKVQLAHEALFPKSAYKRKKTDAIEEIKDTPQFSEEEALFWSSAGMPEQSNKEVQ